MFRKSLPLKVEEILPIELIDGFDTHKSRKKEKFHLRGKTFFLISIIKLTAWKKLSYVNDALI